MKLNRSKCPIAGTLDSLGDRWSILIIRDLLIGAKKYGDLLKSPEKITTNILADRLKKLETAGIISKREYQIRPVRWEYFLTEKGNELSSIINEMVNWGLSHIEGTELPSGNWDKFKKQSE